MWRWCTCFFFFGESRWGVAAGHISRVWTALSGHRPGERRESLPHERKQSMESVRRCVFNSSAHRRSSLNRPTWALMSAKLVLDQWGQSEAFPTTTTTMQRALPAVRQSRKYLIWLFTLSPSVVLWALPLIPQEKADLCQHDQRELMYSLIKIHFT